MSLKSKIEAWLKRLIEKLKPKPEPTPEPPAPTPEPTPEPPAPAPGEFTVNPAWTGFLWKPEGENSKKLRVLLPPEWKRDKFDLNRVEIWSAGKKLETIDPIGPGNPMPGRGDREHFAGNRKGGDYPANCTVRARTVAGEEWEWSIVRPASRNENIRCKLVKADDPPPAPEPIPDPPASDQDFEPPDRKGHEYYVGDGTRNSFREVGQTANPRKSVMLECWASIKSWPRADAGCFLINKGIVGTSWAYALVVGPGWINYQATKGAVQMPCRIPVGEWHHYRVVADNGTAKFWMDGKYLGAVKPNGFALLGVSDQPLRIGGYYCSYPDAHWYNASLNGEMSDFKVEIL